MSELELDNQEEQNIEEQDTVEEAETTEAEDKPETPEETGTELIVPDEIDELLRSAQQMLDKEYVKTPVYIPPEDEELPSLDDQKGFKKILHGYLIPILVGALVALVLTQVMFMNALVPSGSMETTIMTGDHIVGNRMAMWFGKLKNGDVVIFRSDEYDEFMVKRVIGCPGDTVAIQDNEVYVNGHKLNDSYCQGETHPLTDTDSWVVPEGEYFFMGDNRMNSADSRIWSDTYIEKKDIYAKVMFRYSLGGKNGFFLKPVKKITFYEDDIYN